MGKRSRFVRRKHDDYQTPLKAVYPLLPFLNKINTFAEPCCGAGQLIGHLQKFGLVCSYRADITLGVDALVYPPHGEFDAIITNPPWSRHLLHPMIELFQGIAPTWLLFDGDWAYTKQAVPLLDQCSHIVAIGRIKWIPGSPHTAKDNAAWYRFHLRHTGGPKFYGQEDNPKLNESEALAQDRRRKAVAA